jgi:hypothetical protein
MSSGTQLWYIQNILYVGHQQLGIKKLSKN